MKKKKQAGKRTAKRPSAPKSKPVDVDIMADAAAFRRLVAGITNNPERCPTCGQKLK